MTESSVFLSSVFGELSLFYTIAIEVLRCEYELSMSIMYTVNLTCPNLVLQTCLSNKVVDVIVGRGSWCDIFVIVEG